MFVLFEIQACVLCTNMRVVAVVVLFGLMVGQDAGGAGANMPGLDSEKRTRETGGKSVELNLKKRQQVNVSYRSLAVNKEHLRKKSYKVVYCKQLCYFANCNLKYKRYKENR